VRRARQLTRRGALQLCQEGPLALVESVSDPSVLSLDPASRVLPLLRSHSAEIGTIRLVALSNGTVARLLVILLALLALAGCDWAGQARVRSVETTGGATGTASTPTPTRVVSSPTEGVIEAIRTCGVKSIVFARRERTYITFRGGRTIRSKRLNRDKISRDAHGRAKDCNIVIGTELVEETPCPIRVLAGRLVALCPSIPLPR
jgi:hypothetical protein